ncbi:MAG: nuclear transport factor 2 family protein [Verrucomicrobiales bacterium]|nr:nuclear transport factor 2 family protein [Verrucomicrobiales bacterium]
MTRIIVLFLTCLALSGIAEEPASGWQTDSPAAREMTGLNTRLTKAYENEDVALLRTLLAPDHIHNNVFGSVMNRDTFLHDIESGILKFESYQTPELSWMISGDMAVATGLIEAVAVRDGKTVPAKRFRFTRIFVRREGKWQVLLFQNTMAGK